MSSQSEYTGDVTPGSGTQVRALDGITVTKLAVSEMSNNVYLLESVSTGDRLLIDAADSPDSILALMPPPRPGATTQIVTTHSHEDHHGALAQVAGATSALTLAGRADAPLLPIATDRLLDHGDSIELGGLPLNVIGLRGHTPGSVAIVYQEEKGSGRAHIFTGDSLFPGGVGQTMTPEDFASLIADVKTRIFDRFDDQTWIYPGHGADTTLGAERPNLAEWVRRGW